MHELGILYQAVRTVAGVAAKKGISAVSHITLEVGLESGCVPTFFEKLFPALREQFPLIQKAQLRIEQAPGRGLMIKEIGY